MAYQVHTYDVVDGLVWYAAVTYQDIRIAIETMYRVHRDTDKETIVVNDEGNPVCCVGRPISPLTQNGGVQ